MQRAGEALICYDKALELRPGYVEALHNRAIALRDLGRLEERWRAATGLSRWRPALPSRITAALFCFMTSTAPLRRSSAATRRWLSRPLRRCTRQPGQCARTLKRPGEGLVCHARALAVKPDSAEVLNNRGLALADLNRAEEGLADVRAVSLRPGYAEAHANMAVVLDELRRFDEAASAIRRAIALSPACGVLLYADGVLPFGVR